jgi:fibronectin-binding autotransporter adhesin
VGTFGGLPEGSTYTIGVNTFTISYVGGDGNDVVLTVTDATYTWTGADADDRDWTNPGNWVGGVAPVGGVNLVFQANPTRTESINNFNSGTSFTSITVAGSGYDIYGNAIGLTNGITTTYTSGTSAIDLGMILLAGNTFDIAGGGTLTYAGSLSGGFGLIKNGAGTLTLAGTNTYTGGTLVQGGTLGVGSGDNVGSGLIQMLGGVPTLRLTGSLGNDILLISPGTISTEGDATLSGVISGTGILTKAGAGTLTLSGANAIHSQVLVSTGTLVVNGSLASTSVTVANGATLGGLGSISGATAVQSGGTLSPGNSPGGLTFAAGLTLASGSTFAVGIDGTTPVSDYDQISVSGTVGLTGSTLAPSLGFAPAVGDTFRLIDNDDTDPIAGTFAGLAEGSLFTAGAATFRISYVGGTGNDVTLTVVETPAVAGLASANPASFGQAVTFSATVAGTGTPTGDVTLVIDGTTVEAVALVGGMATFAPVSNLSVGSHAVAFHYAGDASHLPSSGTLGRGQVVNKAATTAAVVTPTSPTVVGQSVTFTATVRSAAGTPTGTVTFRNGTTGQVLGNAALDVSGTARFTTSGLTVGTTRIEAEYTGDGSRSGSSAFMNQTVDAAPVPPPPPVVPPVVPVAPPVVSQPPLLSASTGSQVRVFDLVTGQVVRTFTPFPGFGGQVVTATADLTGDGIPDLAFGAGAGGGPHVRVFDGATGAELASFFAFHQGFTGGVNLAAGDVNGDGVIDLIVAAGPGGGPHVKVYDGRTYEVLSQFYAYDVGFAGGVSVAAGDLDGDGRAEIITGAGAGGGPHVKAFDGRTLAVVYSFFAYDMAFTGGVDVAVRDVNSDGFADIVTGAGPGGGPHVKAFDGRTLDVLSQFFAADPAFLGGVSVG